MPHLPASLPGHDGHDPLAIAAYAAGDATGPELDDALALVAACPGCAALHHDLRAIAAALPALPAPVRPRDYRLTPGQAASLRPAGWRRLLAPLAGPRFAFAGPLGTGLATLGIAGLLVAGSFGTRLAGPTATGSAAGAPAPEASAAADAGAEAGPTDENQVYALEASPAPAVVKAQEAASPGTVMAPVTPQVVRVSETAVPAGEPVPGVVTNQAAPAPSEPVASAPAAPAPDGGPAPVLSILSAVALLAGLVLAGLRLAGRRLVGGS